MSKITKIEKIEDMEFVYDPVCDAPHAYISNGFVSHNCVVLFDEIEKAHIDVLNSLLTMMDDGYFTDGSGVKYDLTQCIIVMTSNALAIDFDKNKAGQVGFDDEYSPDMPKETQVEYIEKINMYKSKIITNGFPPEFINRIDGFLLFPSLDTEQLEKICDLQLNEIQSYFKQVKITIDKPSVIEYLIKNINHKEGGRSSKKVIKNIIIPSLMDKLLDNKKVTELFFSKDDINKNYV